MSSGFPTAWKHQMRTVADRLARWSGLLERRERVRGNGLTVLTFHRVLAEERCAAYPFPSLAMPAAAFRAQVRWLAKHREVLPLGLALERNLQNPRTTRPLVALTFDDGYRDAADTAAEELEAAGVRGTFFVTTSFVGTRSLLWFDRGAVLFEQTSEAARLDAVRAACVGASAAPRLRRGADVRAWTAFLKLLDDARRASLLDALERTAGGPVAPDGYAAMTVADLKALSTHGHEIGSHTATHALLPGLDDARLAQEIEGARDTLAGWLGRVVPGFCYPNGDYDARVLAAVLAAGHRYACTTRDGIHRRWDDPMEIRRVDVVPDRALDAARRFDAIALRRELCGLYRRVRSEPATG